MTSAKSGGRLEAFPIVATPPRETREVHDPAAVTGGGGRGDTFDISVKPKGTPRAGEPFDVAVRIENTAGHALPEPHVELGTQLDGEGPRIEQEVPDILGIERLTDEPETKYVKDAASDSGERQARTFGRGKVETIRFRVTPRIGLARATLVASAFVLPDGISDIDSGALTIKSIPLTADTPAAATRGGRASP